jgi:HAE1 family hydrophobic/amphiphilic exporter-1
MAEILPTLPPDVNVAVTRDQSEFIENSLHAIEEHLIIGGILAAVVVFLFLWNVRSTIIAALAIPVSIIASFAAIAALGYSLNQMTMLALTLMVGIVIDDAIVVLENIYRYVEEKGMHPFQAAIEGTREIGLAVLATTLSLLAVFIPVGFMTGIVGRFMSSFGLTSAAAIAVSLIVSFTLTPMLAARWIKAKDEGGKMKDEENPNFENHSLEIRDGKMAADDRNWKTSTATLKKRECIHFKRQLKARAKSVWRFLQQRFRFSPYLSPSVL